MKQTKISYNLDGLEDIRREVGDTWRARVGILGSKASRPGKGPLNNAELGLIQMFGSVTNNIPPRDFLLQPIADHAPELMKAMTSGPARAAFEKRNFKKLFTILGAAGEAIVKQGFSTRGYGKWAALKTATIKAKGSSAPLIDTTELWHAQTSDAIKKSDVI